MISKLIGHTLTFAGALFNQLTLYVTHWRRNYLHKKGNRVKVSLRIKNKNFLQMYILIFEDEYAFPCQARWTNFVVCHSQIIEACLISVITSAISFGLPLFRRCTPCPEADANSGIECPQAPGMFGNYVNVRSYVTYDFCVILSLFNHLVSITLLLWLYFYHIFKLVTVMLHVVILFKSYAHPC